jgi:hypothetical protein
MSAAFGQIEYLHNHPERRRLCAKAEDGIWSMAADDSAIRVGLLLIDRDSVPMTGKFLIRHDAFMPTQSRGHGTRPTPQSGGRPVPTLRVGTRGELQFKV